MDKSQVKTILREEGVNVTRETSTGFNIRCNICGDSKKSTKKTRGWILFNKDGRATYYCHNCNVSMSFKRYLKEYYPTSHRKYFREFKSFKIEDIQDSPGIAELSKDDKLVKEDISYILKDIAVLIIDDNIKSIVLKDLQQRALSYCKSRDFPEEKINQLYVCYEDYKENGKIKYYLKLRIIIPFFKDNTMYAFQGRSLLDNSLIKYMTIKESNDIKIYNYFNVDKNKPVFVTEGPIDSWFIDNCIATSGSVSTDSEIVGRIDRKFDNVIWVFDNDSTGISKRDSFLKEGHKVFIWNKRWRECKDVNEVVSEWNITKEEVTEHILQYSRKGLSGIVLAKLFT